MTALETLAEMKRLPLCTFKPGVNVVTGESKFARWLDAEVIIKALFGGNRTGKTETGGFEFVCALLGESLERYLPYMTPEGQIVARKWMRLGSRNGWAASVSYGLQPEGNQQKIMRYLPPDEIAAVSWLRKSENILSQITLKNGRVCSFKSYEQGREDFQAAGVGIVWCDEEPPKDIWQEIGLRQEAGVTLYRLLTMTPVNGMTWVYTDIYKSISERIHKETVGWDDNPHLTEQQKAEMSEGLSDEELQMRREGKFVKKQGLVFKSFNQSVHVVPASFAPEEERYTFYRAFDFGFAQDHPFVALFFAVDTDGTVYVFDELYLRETGQRQVMKRIHEKSAGYTIRGSWGDSARPDWIDFFNNPNRDMAAGETPLHPIPTKLAIKDVEAGISKVEEYLSLHPVSKKPRLYISARCTELIEQMEQYVYPKVKDEVRGKQLPEKDKDDGPDTLRYFLMSYSTPREEPQAAVFTKGKQKSTGSYQLIGTAPQPATAGFKIVPLD